jgi:putative flippase GtrA
LFLTITQIRSFAHGQPKELKRFVKFATVGAFGAISHFLVDNVLIQLAGLSFAVANHIGFTVAVLQNFYLNRRWTFPESKSRKAGMQLTQFAIVSIIGLALNQAVALTTSYLLKPLWLSVLMNPDLAEIVNYNFALAIAIGVVLFWNFLANRFWTYRGL